MRAYMSDMYTTLLHSAQLMIDSGSHDTATWHASQESKRKEFPRSSACSTVSDCLVCSGMHARYTDVFNVFLSIPLPGVDGVSLCTWE